jgi:hypothetical protein
MANVDRPSGLTPVRTLTGAPFNNQTQQYTTATNSGAIYPGDLVMLNSDRAVVLFSTGFNALGVMVGRSDDITRDSTKYVPANTAAKISVCVDPQMLYSIQQTNASTVTAVGNNSLGLLTDLTLTTGDATRGISQVTLPSATAFLGATGTSALVRIWEVEPLPNNTATDVGARVLVTINESVLRSTVGPAKAA